MRSNNRLSVKITLLWVQHNQHRYCRKCDYHAGNSQLQLKTSLNHSCNRHTDTGDSTRPWSSRHLTHASINSGCMSSIAKTPRKYEIQIWKLDFLPENLMSTLLTTVKNIISELSYAVGSCDVRYKGRGTKFGFRLVATVVQWGIR
jgi:hypothetical protein